MCDQQIMDLQNDHLEQAEEHDAEIEALEKKLKAAIKGVKLAYKRLTSGCYKGKTDGKLLCSSCSQLKSKTDDCVSNRNLESAIAKAKGE